MKAKKILGALIAALSLSVSVTAFSHPLQASASHTTVPKSLRGTWYEKTPGDPVYQTFRAHSVTTKSLSNGAKWTMYTHKHGKSDLLFKVYRHSNGYWELKYNFGDSPYTLEKRVHHNGKVALKSLSPGQGNGGPKWLVSYAYKRSFNEN